MTEATGTGRSSELCVSIVIPTYNRRDALLETLGALERVKFPSNEWEAIVVDDGSTDDTELAVQGLMKRSSVPLRYVRQVNKGAAAARNKGASLARGIFLIFIDNDIVVEPNFLQNHVETLNTNPGCWIVGRVTHPPQMRSTPFGRFRDDICEAFARSYPSDRLMQTDGITAANISMPTKDFRRLGGYDEDFAIASSEDWELGMCARESGIRILFHPGIVVIHNDWAISLDRYCERQRLYSLSDVLLCQKYGIRSPRYSLVKLNSPVRFGQDPPALIATKLLKRLMGSWPARKLIGMACRVLEGLAPDSSYAKRAYHLAIGIAIFRGVRDGFKRYKGGSQGCCKV